MFRSWRDFRDAAYAYRYWLRWNAFLLMFVVLSSGISLYVGKFGWINWFTITWGAVAMVLRYLSRHMYAAPRYWYAVDLFGAEQNMQHWSMIRANHNGDTPVRYIFHVYRHEHIKDRFREENLLDLPCPDYKPTLLVRMGLLDPGLLFCKAR